MYFFNFATILISLVSLLFSLVAFIYQIRINYPSIKIEPIFKKRESENEPTSAVFHKETKSLYFFAKINVINLSPTRGCLHNCFLKCRHAKKIPNLTESEILSLPKPVYAHYQNFAKNNELFSSMIKAEPLEEKTAIVVFNLNYKFIIPSKYKISATYYGESKFKATMKLNSPLKKSHTDTFNEVFDALFEKEFLK